MASKKRIPSDILIPSALNKVDEGRYENPVPFSLPTPGAKSALASPGNYAHSVVEVVQQAIDNGDITAAGGANLAYTAAAGQGTVTSDTGTDATVPAVTGTNAGLMLPAHKTKLDNITVTQAVDLDTMESDIAAKQVGIQYQEEGSNLGTSGTVTTVNFVGTNVTAARVSDTVTVTVGGASAPSHDALSLGGVLVNSFRTGGTASVLTTPSAGEHTITVQSGAYLQTASIFGNNTDLNGSNEFLVRIDNSANSLDRRVLVQVYDANNGALVDQQVTATNHTQTVSGNVTLLTFPGMNGFGATGFWIELR